MICSKCKMERNETEFHKDGRGGIRNQCKFCRSLKKIKNKSNTKFNKSLSESINRSIRKNKNGFIWETVLGFTLNDLVSHLEKRFDKNMNWCNYGQYWILSKIIPVNYYKYSDRVNNEFLKAWSIKNFIPITRADFNKKRNTVSIEDVEKYNLYDILPIGLLHFIDEKK